MLSNADERNTGDQDRGPAEHPAARSGSRWSTLPERVTPDQMVEEIPAEPPHDPDGGRDPGHEWMLRHG